MSGNPFLVPGGLSTALDREDCQRIHYQALQAAVRGSRPGALPASVPLSELKERARFDGAEVYLAHPDDIERLFAGITLERCTQVLSYVTELTTRNGARSIFRQAQSF